MHLSPGRAFRTFVANRAARWKRGDDIRSLSGADGPEGSERAEQALDGPDRLSAIKALGRVDPEKARPTLERLADGSDKWDRRFALQVLRETRGREMWPELLHLAKDCDDSVAFDAYRGLDEHAGSGDIAELLAVAEQVADGEQRKRLLALVSRLERR